MRQNSMLFLMKADSAGNILMKLLYFGWILNDYEYAQEHTKELCYFYITFISQ